jgi:hypothetical protein
MQVRRTTYAVLAIGFLTGSAAMAQDWWGDDPYWKQSLGTSSSSVVAGHDVRSQPLQYVQGPSETMTDAGSHRERARTARDDGTALVEGTEAERRLERAGFPQYSQ